MRALLREEGRNRWVWNQAVAARKSGALFNDGMLTDARAENDWLATGSVVAQQQTLRDFRASKQRNRRFRSKRCIRPTLNYTQRGFSLKTTESGTLRLVVATGIVLPVVWSRNLPAAPSSVRIRQDSVGHWWASFVVDREHNPTPPSNAEIGIDWGLTQIATTTNPAYDLPNPRLGRKHAAQLAAAHRRMARRQPAPGRAASRGYKQAKRQTALINEHVRNARREIARDWARKVTADHALIAIEDFRPRFMFKSRLARSAADAGVGIAKTTLIEYAEREGRRVALVNPAYTTMDCSECGARAKTSLSLSERVYVCELCGARLGRDLNAARNILARAGSAPAGVDAVRRKTAIGGRPHAEPGISRRTGEEGSTNKESPRKPLQPGSRADVDPHAIGARS